MTPEHDSFLRAAAALIGETYVRRGFDAEPYQRDWRGRYRGEALAVVLAANTEQVAALVKLCRASQIAIVPQAGNTGLVGGAIVPEGIDAIILNVSRLSGIRSVDRQNNSMVVDAGCILADVRDAAHRHDRQFPMLLGSVGSCEIGGLVSTNAGGTGVLRYGNMRELVLGLEVVLADGTVWDGLKALRKDNTGYDLKQIFIGAEGTLGIITAAVLKLHPQMRASATAMVALRSVEHAIALLQHVQDATGGRLEAFELMSRSQLDIVLRHNANATSPLSRDEPWFVLLELADSAADWDAREHLERALDSAMQAGFVVDAVIATDEAKAQRIWELRHTISEANKREGFTISNDTSVPISALPAFIARVTARLGQRFETATICHCGHIGDGNVHVIIILPRAQYAGDAAEHAASDANTIVHQESVALGGSISAEHGIGKMHIDRLPLYASAIELTLMRKLKQALDPDGVMNPVKVFRQPA
ncbi:MAG: FAD-dependent oxidoreductase [Tardiphaga sp.]|nr:FAD-dependent oxidoreductase [Tardiphaga sp.]